MPRREAKGPKAIYRYAIARYRSANVALRASLWFTICSIVQKGITVITMPIFTRIMSTEEYGRYSVFLTWYNILTLLVTLNVHSEVFNKGLIEHSEEKDAFTASQAGLLIALTLLWLAIYLPLQGFFNHLLGLTTALMLFMLMEILGSALTGLWSARRRFDFDYRSIASLTLTMSVVNPLAGIIAVRCAQHKAEARIIANAVTHIALGIGLLAVFKRKGRLFAHRRWWRPTLAACLPLVPHYLSLVLLNQSDKLMINYYTGPTDAAIYSVAHSAGLLMTIINNSINGAFVPWAYERLKNHQGEGIRRISNMLMGIVVFVNVALIWLAPEAIRLLAAPQYADAKWCLVPIAMSVYFYFCYTLFVDVEIYYGANYYIAIASVCAAGMNIILNAVFIPRYGFIAAGYTTLVSYFATMLLHLLFLRRVLRKQPKPFALFDLKTLTLLSLAMVLLSAVAMGLYKHTWIRLSMILICFSLVIVCRNKLKLILKMMKHKE